MEGVNRSEEDDMEVNLPISTCHCGPALGDNLSTKLCSSASTLVENGGRQKILTFLCCCYDNKSIGIAASKSFCSLSSLCNYATS